MFSRGERQTPRRCYSAQNSIFDGSRYDLSAITSTKPPYGENSALCTALVSASTGVDTIAATTAGAIYRPSDGTRDTKETSSEVVIISSTLHSETSQTGSQTRNIRVNGLVQPVVHKQLFGPIVYGALPLRSADGGTHA